MTTSITTATCVCTSFYTGFLCEFANPCAFSVCRNGATCVITDISGSEPKFQCVCPTNFTGNYCETNLNTLCTPYTCFNRGECFNDALTGNARCLCQPLYTGIFLPLFKIKINFHFDINALNKIIAIKSK